MLRSFRSWHLFVLVPGVCALAFASIYWWNSRRTADVASLFRRLPSERALVAGLNVKALRDAGILDSLAGSRSLEELDYREFIEQTGFDYREDLDYIAAAIDSEHKYFLLRGRFDWALMKRFSAAKGAQCANLFCAIKGTDPGKNVSYFPLAQDVLALAQGFAPKAAYSLMTERGAEMEWSIPDYALWASVPGPLLSANRNLPDGMKAFASTLSSADRVTVGLASAAEGFEARMDAECPNGNAANELGERLRTLTGLLQKMIARGGQQPKPGELGGVLAAGKFEASGRTVKARWPIPREFLDSLVSGTP